MYDPYVRVVSVKGHSTLEHVSHDGLHEKEKKQADATSALLKEFFFNFFLLDWIQVYKVD